MYSCNVHHIISIGISSEISKDFGNNIVISNGKHCAMLLTVSEEGYPQFGILKACSSNAAERRMKFLNSSSRVAMRSLEEGVDGGVELVMRPLKDRARSLSPLKQLRTYSFRSTPSEESFLNDVVASFLRYNFLTDDNKVKIYGKMCFFKINLREGFGEMNEVFLATYSSASLLFELCDR